MTIKLHCFGESGNAYKAALTLELAGLDWTPVFVDFFNGAARSKQYHDTVNAMGEVPVMIDGELHLTQSGVIQQYVAERTGKFGGGAQDRLEVLRWQFWDNHKLSGMAGVARFLANYLPDDKRAAQGPTIAFLKSRLLTAYGVLDARLQGRDWLVGDGPTIGDLSCCGYLYYDEPFGFTRADWPGIDAWLDRIAALPGWKHPYDLMPPARPENVRANLEG